MKVYLIWMEGERTRREEVTGQGVIGRVSGDWTPDVAFPKNATTISRRHCQLALEGDTVTLTDMSSLNGTWVGDSKITAPTKIPDGGTFEVGRVAPNPKKDVAEERGVIIRVEIINDDLGDDPSKTSAGLGSPTTVS